MRSSTTASGSWRAGTRSTSAGSPGFYAFDLLELDGTDLRREPIEVRKATLASILRKSRPRSARPNAGITSIGHAIQPENNR